MTWLYQRYRRIAKSISPPDITSNFDQEELSWDNLFSGNISDNTTELFLGKYSKDGILFIIRRFGLDRQARRLGFRHLSVRIDTRDPYRHKLIIYNGSQEDPEHIIMEFVARYQNLTPRADEAEFQYHHPLRILMIEWLLLQNPQEDFTEHKPRLPGQRHPGLGIGDELLALFSIMGRHLQVDGIVNVPEYFHTGLLFSKRFVFLNPAVQAQVRQIAKDLWKKYRLAIIAWAATTGAIINLQTGEPLVWKPRRQIIPLQNQLKQYFKSEAYQAIATRQSDRKIYTVDENKLKTALEAMEEPPFRL